MHAGEVGIHAHEGGEAVFADARDEHAATAAPGLIGQDLIILQVRAGDAHHQFDQRLWCEILALVGVGDGFFLVDLPEVVLRFGLHGVHPRAECCGEVVCGVFFALNAETIATHDFHIGVVIPQEGVDGEGKPVVQGGEETHLINGVEGGRDRGLAVGKGLGVLHSSVVLQIAQR